MQERLWDTSDIAEYLGLSTQHVRDRVVCQPRFPGRISFPTTQGRSKPRWKREEIIEWTESYQERKQSK